MKISIHSEQELIKICAEAIHILCNLRNATDKWNSGHGYELRRRKEYWEKESDELLKRLQVTEHRNPSQIKIEVNAHQIQSLPDKLENGD